MSWDHWVSQPFCECSQTPWWFVKWQEQSGRFQQQSRKNVTTFSRKVCSIHAIAKGCIRGFGNRTWFADEDLQAQVPLSAPTLEGAWHRAGGTHVSPDSTAWDKEWKFLNPLGCNLWRRGIRNITWIKLPLTSGPPIRPWVHHEFTMFWCLGGPLFSLGLSTSSPSSSSSSSSSSSVVMFIRSAYLLTRWIGN